MSWRHHDLRGEAGGGRLPRRDGRRHHRGGLPDRVRGRLRGGLRDRQAHQAIGGVRAVAGGREGHRPRRRGGEGRQAAAHPHLHLHLAGAPQVQAAEVGRAGAGDGALPGRQSPQLGGGRGVVGGGRDAHRDRLPVPLRGDGHQGRRHHHQPARYGGLCDAGGILPDVPHRARARAGGGQGDLLGALPQRSRHGGGQLAGRRAGPARGRSNAPSTASASGPATRRWKRS